MLLNAMQHKISTDFFCAFYQLTKTFLSLCHCSITQSRPTLCNPMDCNMPDLPVLHYLLEFAQTHVHSVDGAIQLSRPLLPPSSPALNLSQHFRVFSNESALHIRWPKYWSFSSSNKYSELISFRFDGNPRDSQESPTAQFESINYLALSLLLQSYSHPHDYWRNHSFNYMDLCQQSDVFAF